LVGLFPLVNGPSSPALLAGGLGVLLDHAETLVAGDLPCPKCGKLMRLVVVEPSPSVREFDGSGQDRKKCFPFHHESPDPDVSLCIDILQPSPINLGGRDNETLRKIGCTTDDCVARDFSDSAGAEQLRSGTRSQTQR